MSTKYPRVARVVKEKYGNGQCVALARAMGFKISGSAYAWPSAAKKAGYTVDDKPAKGSIIVTSESSYGTHSGHVIYQTGEMVNGWIPVKEQNYKHLTVTVGFINVNNPRIRAYIHKPV